MVCDCVISSNGSAPGVRLLRWAAGWPELLPPARRHVTHGLRAGSRSREVQKRSHGKQALKSPDLLPYQSPRPAHAHYPHTKQDTPSPDLSHRRFHTLVHSGIITLTLGQLTVEKTNNVRTIRSFSMSWRVKSLWRGGILCLPFDI